MKVGKVSLMHWLPLIPRKYSWFSYLLEAELTPEPYCSLKDYVNERSGIEPATY